jgi:CBS domain containing-hemolysin-like protein
VRFLLIIPILIFFFLTVYCELIRRADYNADEEDQKRASEEKRFFYSFLLFFECFFSAVTAAFVIGIFRGKYPIASFLVSAIIISSSVCVLPTLLRRIITDEFTKSAKRLGDALASVTYVKPVTLIGEALYKKLSSRKAEPTMTHDEMMSVVDTLEEEGDFDEDESEIIKGAIRFADMTAQMIMIPRVDIRAFDINEGVEALASDSELLEYSRIPIYDKNIDDIIGVLPTKLLIRELGSLERDKWETLDLRPLLLTPFYIHMTRDISSLLKQFREEKRQMAIVVDEYGGTMGIITAEDIIEEIVGDIFDESDDIERDYIKLQNGYEVDGLISLDDFRRLVEHTEEYESDYSTLGGWAAEMLDKIPEEGDSFDFENLTVTVTEMDSNRVKRLTVEIHTEEPETEEKE